MKKIRNIVSVVSIIAFTLTTVPVNASLTISTSHDAETESSSNSGSVGVDAESTLEVGIGNEESEKNEEAMKKENEQAMEVEGQSESGVSVDLPGIDFRVESDAGTSASADIKTSTQVQSNVDLKTYASFVTADSENVEGVEAKENRVTVTYKEKVRLFGFVPLTVRNRAEVTLQSASASNVQAHVRVRQPWWKFLYRAQIKASDTVARIKQNVDAALQANTVVDASAHARVIEAVETSIRSETRGSVNN